MKYAFCCILYISYLMFITLTTSGFTLDKSDLEDSIKCELTENGFENLSVVLEDRRVIVTYENRIYRNEIEAIRKVIKACAESSRSKGMDVTLVPQNRKVPLVAVTIPADEYTSLLNGKTSDEKLASAIDVSLDVNPILGKIENTQRTNSSSYKFDIVVHPQFKAQFGTYEGLAESQTNLVPEMKTTLWKGMSLSAQLIIPLQNELGEEGDSLRPGLLTLNQTLRLPYNSFLSATVGYFTRNRYGADLEVKKYLANGRLSISANVGYTGYAEYAEGVWYHTDINRLTSLFTLGCRLPQFDLSLSATYGKFLHEDRGWRFDVLRQFGEVDIGFFFLKTETEDNGGFNFSIPIPPSKGIPTWPVRISPAKSFPWEYRYKGFPKEGIQYKTGNSIDEFIKRLNPDYTKKQIIFLK